MNSIARAIQDLCILNAEFLVAEACQMYRTGYYKVVKAKGESH